MTNTLLIQTLIDRWTGSVDIHGVLCEFMRNQTPLQSLQTVACAFQLRVLRGCNVIVAIRIFGAYMLLCPHDRESACTGPS